MKKILLAIIALIFAPAIIHSDFQEKIWRSTRTGTGELFNSTFASGPVIIGAIIISSPSMSGNSYMRVMKSTSATYDPLTASTGPAVATTMINGSIGPGTRINWNTVSSSWTYLDKRGDADIQILWDWWKSNLANPTNSLP